MMDHVIQQSRRIADRLENILSAACEGTVSCEDAARMGYVGIGVAANNAVMLSAMRMQHGLAPLPAPSTGRIRVKPKS